MAIVEVSVWGRTSVAGSIRVRVAPGETVLERAVASIARRTGLVACGGPCPQGTALSRGEPEAHHYSVTLGTPVREGRRVAGYTPREEAWLAIPAGPIPWTAADRAEIARQRAAAAEYARTHCLDCDRPRAEGAACAWCAAEMEAADRDAREQAAREDAARAERETREIEAAQRAWAAERAAEAAAWEAEEARRAAALRAELAATAASAGEIARAIAARRHAAWLASDPSKAARYGAHPRPRELHDALRQDAVRLGLVAAPAVIKDAAAVLWQRCVAG